MQVSEGQLNFMLQWALEGCIPDESGFVLHPFRVDGSQKYEKFGDGFEALGGLRDFIRGIPLRPVSINLWSDLQNAV